MALPPEGNTPPPDQPKETREELLKELEKVQNIIERYSPFYNEMTKVANFFKEELKDIHEKDKETQDSVALFAELLDRAHEVDTKREEYLAAINRKAEITKSLNELEGK